MIGKTTAENNSEWTLFLDRDGVINELLPGRYVSQWEEFRFKEGVLEGLAEIGPCFKYIFIITNQQGIGKNLMSQADLNIIHSKMLVHIEKMGGRIDGIRFCPHLAAENCDCRKPGIGMIRDLMALIPDIANTQKILLGDSPSDFQLATRIKAQCFGMRHQHNRLENWTTFDLTEVNSFSEFKQIVLNRTHT